MKFYYLLLVFLFSFSIFAQNEVTTPQITSTKRNELKLNPLFFIIGLPEISYERILSEDKSAGISLRFPLENNLQEKLSITPYYRIFFGNNILSTGSFGEHFFVEGFAMYSLYKVNYTETLKNLNENFYTVYLDKTDTYSTLGLGFSIGGKWVSKNGFVFELYGGAGRNILNQDYNEKHNNKFIGRGGLTIGYQF